MPEIRNDRLRTLQKKAEAAGRKFEEGEKHLYRGDGKPLFAEDVHKGELDKLARERNGVLSEIEEEVAEIGRDVGADFERLRNADPADWLSADELATANARRAFALDAAEGMGTDAFIRRLESVVAGGDRGVIYAHLVAAQRKREGILERRRGQAARNGGSPAERSLASGSVPTHTALDGVIDEMERALVGEEREAALEGAQATRSEAADVKMAVYKIRHGGLSPAGVWAARNYAVPGPGRAEEVAEVERLAGLR